MRNNKKGITVTSITVYIILFFMFTTITTIISSRFNENLFSDRGMAINITAINKLEYNLLKSSDESYNVNVTKKDDDVNLEFSNGDKYVFDHTNRAVYKNGGKLVGFLKNCDVRITDTSVKLNISLNKYTNEVSRTLVINNSVIDNYVKSNLLIHYDGINNTGTGYHDDDIKSWVDLSINKLDANSLVEFDLDGTNSGWVSDGFTMPQLTNVSENAYFNTIMPANYSMSDATVEFSMTPLSELGTLGNSYIYPVSIKENNLVTLLLGTRLDVRLMYYSGHNTVFAKASNKHINKDNTYTLTFVQDSLSTRSIYLNGELEESMTNLSLQNINFGLLRIIANEKVPYVMHSVRIYDKALTDDEIRSNYVIDKMRFGE